MKSAIAERRDQEYLRRIQKTKRLKLPSWWRHLAPGRGPRFWAAVEVARKESGVQRWDTSGMTFIIEQLNRRTT